MNFSITVSEALKYYVYRLVDPRDGTTFYIGKGYGNRMFQHESNASKEKNDESLKDEKIQTIVSEGFKPEYIIHRHGLDENTAFEVEAALIQAYPNLTNEQGGHDSDERGAKTVLDILEQYELPSMPTPNFPVLVININHIKNRRDHNAIYNQVKGHWVLNPKNARKANYVIAAFKGIAIGIFQPKEWYASEKPRRYCFEGSKAPQEVWDTYVGTYGKRIDNKALKNSQNPVKYFFP